MLNHVDFSPSHLVFHSLETRFGVWKLRLGGKKGRPKTASFIKIQNRRKSFLDKSESVIKCNVSFGIVMRLRVINYFDDSCNFVCRSMNRMKRLPSRGFVWPPSQPARASGTPNAKWSHLLEHESTLKWGRKSLKAWNKRKNDSSTQHGEER